MMSLSRAYVIPTWQIIALTTCFQRMVTNLTTPRRLLVWWDKKHIFILLSCSVGWIVFLYCLARLLAR